MHEKAEWQRLHDQPMNLAFGNDLKRKEEKNRLKGFLNETVTEEDQGATKPRR